MTVLALRKDICHTEAIEDDCGFRLVNVCHEAPRSWGLSDSCICTDDELGLRCEEIAPVLRVDDCGCLCC
mgnify:CR=1 FL=1